MVRRTSCRCSSGSTASACIAGQAASLDYGDGTRRPLVIGSPVSSFAWRGVPLDLDPDQGGLLNLLSAGVAFASRARVPEGWLREVTGIRPAVIEAWAR
jgi:hypothetical protein